LGATAEERQWIRNWYC